MPRERKDSRQAVRLGNRVTRWVSAPCDLRLDQEASCTVPVMLSDRIADHAPTVLVVDDSPEIRRYLRTLLELEHYCVETASCGSEALQRVREGLDPAVILLDVQMPGMDGLCTLRHLRRIDPDAKVIMCSGVADPRTMRRAHLMGAQAYVTKPIQHLYLSAAVERCLGDKQTRLGYRRNGVLAVMPSAAGSA